MSTLENDVEDFHERVKKAKKQGKDEAEKKAIDWKRNSGMASTPEDPPKKKKDKHMKPKGARGRAAVRRLGRNYKTGNFEKGVKDLEAEGHSSESAHRIMGAQYWGKVKKHRGKK